MIKLLYLALVVALLSEITTVHGKKSFRHPPRPECQKKADEIEEKCGKSSDCKVTDNKEYIPIFDYPKDCDPNYKYRSNDGSCNNLRVTWFGMPETPFLRITGPKYEGNSNGEPTLTGKNGNLLPNARLVSMIIHENKQPNEEIEWSHLFPFFGQFIDHDITLTAAVADPENPSIHLECSCDSTSPDCLIIETPANDAVNSNQNCMATARSSRTVTGQENGRFKNREQMNIITAWIDLSQIYGSSKDEADSLRQMTNGLLKSSYVQDSELMPEESSSFFAGDIRANENLGLQNQQIMWLRNHNRIARELLALNQQWDDEKLYQEARKINIALFQHIIYNEWLEQVVGLDIFDKYDLSPAKEFKYDSRLNPSINNEFATAAFRFGHTLIDDTLSRIRSDGSVVGAEEMKDNFFPDISKYHSNAGYYDEIGRGCLFDKQNEDDRHFGNALLDHLFETEEQPLPNSFFRLSLPALNIERSRDHGLKGYSYYKDLYDNDGVKSETFSHLANVMSAENYGALASVYSNVEDIDLFAGGLSETSLTNPGTIKTASVGRTFANIIADQFRVLKFSDRFFYQKRGVFSPEQLKNIEEIRMAHIICLNANVDKVQDDPFRVNTFDNNSDKDCSEYSALNYELWRENGNDGPTGDRPPPPPPNGGGDGGRGDGGRGGGGGGGRGGRGGRHRR